MCAAGDSGESFGLSDCGHRQEEVLGAFGHHGGPVYVDHQETHPAAFREGHLSLCGQNCPTVQVSAQNKTTNKVNTTLTETDLAAFRLQANQIPTSI